MAYLKRSFVLDKGYRPPVVTGTEFVTCCV
jgi:hypothetical protein